MMNDMKENRDSSWKLSADNLLEDRGGRLLVPNDFSLKTKIILEAHEPAFAGHFGIKRTKELVKRNWKWASINEDVEQNYQVL